MASARDKRITGRWLAVIGAVVALGLGAVVAFGETIGTHGDVPKSGNRVVNTATTRAGGSIALTNETWVCNGPVDLDSVTVTMTAAGPRGGDAVHLASGCTGRIGHLAVTEYVADGVKVTEGAHDLTIGGGSVRCLAKSPSVHQDGIQVMGGARITFNRLNVSCGRAGASLINSNLFIKQAGRSNEPPTDVVCVDCVFGGGAAHTVNIQDSVRSGVVGSSLCEARYPKLTLTIGRSAVAPVDVRNTIGC
jgi:hypothetical protein